MQSLPLHHAVLLSIFLLWPKLEERTADGVSDGRTGAPDDLVLGTGGRAVAAGVPLDVQKLTSIAETAGSNGTTERRRNEAARGQDKDKQMDSQSGHRSLLNSLFHSSRIHCSYI